MVQVGRDDVWCGDLLAVLSVECFLFLLRFYQCYEATIQCFRCIKGTLEKDYAQEVYCCSLDVKLLFRFVSPFRCTWLLFSRTKVIDMDSRVFYMKSCERHQGVGDTIN